MENKLDARGEPCVTTISIKGNAGSRMTFKGVDVVIDLDGIITTHNDKPVPLLYDHNNNEQLGYAAGLTVNKDGVFLDGKLTINSDRVDNIRDSWRAGQPWQASLGFVIVDGENVPDGASAIVNGREELGPVTIAHAIEIMECSIVTFGADDRTEILNASKNTDENGGYITAAASVVVNNAVELDAPAINVKHKGNTMTENETKPNNTRIAALACLMQAGAKVNPAEYKESELEAANQLKGLDFRSIVEAASGWQATHAERSDCGEWLRAAASSFGLNQILQTISSELLIKFVDVENELWRQVFKVTSCTDTRPSYRFKELGEFMLKKNIAGQDMEHAVYSDVKAVISADLYTRQFAITEEEVLAGNSIGALEDILKQAAVGASRTVRHVLWSKFLDPQNCQFDGQAFFSGARGNVSSGMALNYDNLATAIGAFHKLNNRGINPSILLVPSSLWAKAQTLCKATNFYTTAGTGADVNPIISSGVRPVCVPDLELADNGGAYSQTTWYLLAEPNVIPAFEATFIGGNSTPRLRRQDINIGFAGIKFDCTLGFGCAQLDPAGIWKYTE